jgi:hypothetical protein
VKRVNPTAIFLISLVLVLAALFIKGPVGGVLLLLIAAGAAALLVGSWNQLPLTGRIARLAVLGLILVAAVSRFR